MKKLVILGAGTAGTMAANKLRKVLDPDWSITIVDQDDNHIYQPGYLFVPFGKKPTSIVRSRKKYVNEGITFLCDPIERVKPEVNEVELAHHTLTYDWLIIASGSHPRPDLVPGMADGALWHTKVHDFYTLAGAQALHDALQSFDKGKILVHICEMPIKCPVAPLEMTFLIEDHFRKAGRRHEVDITFVTPLDGAFTKPVASKKLGGLLEERSVRTQTDFTVQEVDNDAQELVSYDGRRLPFDLLVTIPPHTGAQFIADSGLGDDMAFVPVDKHTLRSHEWDNIFVLGDASNIPTSKAGAVAHFEVDLFADNFLAAVAGKPLPNAFDGHANCFIESGRGEALLLDFNYDTEPLTGTYPIPGIGPLSLLRRSPINHLGKLGFEYLYWSVLLPGYRMPVPALMSTKGKNFPDS